MTNTTSNTTAPAFDPAKKALIWFDFHKKQAFWEGEKKLGWCTIPAAFDPNEKITSWSSLTWEDEAESYAYDMNNNEYTAGTHTAVIPYTQEAFDKFVADCMRWC